MVFGFSIGTGLQRKEGGFLLYHNGESIEKSCDILKSSSHHIQKISFDKLYPSSSVQATSLLSTIPLSAPALGRKENDRFRRLKQLENIKQDIQGSP